MKRKLLLIGENKRLINDFFSQLDFDFECMSSSAVYLDLKTHYKYFKPAAVVYCMSSENKDDVINFIRFINDVDKNDHTAFIVISNVYDYEFLCKSSDDVKVDLQIGNNLSVHEMRDEIKNLLRNIIIKLSNDGGFITKNKDTSEILAQLEADIAGMNLHSQSENQPLSKAGQPSLNIKKPDLSNGRRARILVIDDSTIVHKTIKGYLGEDYDISTAISGEMALKFLKTKSVDLILLDYEMPKMDGVNTLRALRSIPLTARIPVVFLTGVNDPLKIQKILSLKPEGYLLKPIDKKVLINKLKEFI